MEGSNNSGAGGRQRSEGGNRGRGRGGRRKAGRGRGKSAASTPNPAAKRNNNKTNNNNKNNKNTTKNGNNNDKKKSATAANAKTKFVDESYKIWIDDQLQTFKTSDEIELKFPPTLNNTERKYVHDQCSKLGLASKSRGKGTDRYLTISKKVVKKGDKIDLPLLSLGNATQTILNEYMNKFPPSQEEVNRILNAKLPTHTPSDDYEILLDNIKKIDSSIERLDNAHSTAQNNENIVKSEIEREYQWKEEAEQDVSESRKHLPIWNKRAEIMNMIENSTVTIISASTGAGKSTQVPQYLLMGNENHNIICTQPRRLSTISLADRVASENGSQVGDLIGYSVRLERKKSNQTRLLYCTTGVVLRDLAVNKGSLSTVTHLIIDEVHERDINSDFLLLIVREMLANKNCKLKLILMSATLHVEMFKSYFLKYNLVCNSVQVPGRMFPVHQLYLEDALSKTDFVSKLIEKYESVGRALQGISISEAGQDAEADVQTDGAGVSTFAQEKIVCQMCGSAFSSPDEFALHAAFCTGEKKPNIDYEKANGSSSSSSSSSSVLGINWAQNLSSVSCWEQANDDDDDDDGDGDDTCNNYYGNSHQKEEAETLATTQDSSKTTNLLEGMPEPALNGKKPADLLDMYQYGRQLIGLDDDTALDQDLILEILEQIERANDNIDKLAPKIQQSIQKQQDENENAAKPKQLKGKGSVLIFLAGWDEITKLVDTLEAHPRFGNQQKYQVLPLHSGVSTTEQKKVFKRPGGKIRKIICSTNIAETSITIDDVIYVIDAGTSKMKRYDPHTKVSSLMASQIAKANAIQRSGRAGRVQAGVCYRLYSQKRFDAMLQEEAPEMQRSAMEEVCLQSIVLLERHNKSIFGDKKLSVAEFLVRAPDPPSALSIHNAMILLRDMGAIDENENLTDLGRALSKLALHPVLGRMVLFGSILGIRDDAVTLSAFFSVGRDPFVLPINGQKHKERALKRLTGGCNSDHYAYVRVYDEWMKNRNRACSEYFLSYSVMSTVEKTRKQINYQIPNTLSQISLPRQQRVSRLHQIELLATIGTFPNVAQLKPGSKKLVSGSERGIFPHVSSCVKMKSSSVPGSHQWVVYNEMIRSRRACSIRGITQVQALCIALLVGEFTMLQSDNNKNDKDSDGDGDGDDEKSSVMTIVLSDWIELVCADPNHVLLLGVFRDRLNRMIQHCLSQNTQGLTFFEYSTSHTLFGLCESEATGVVPQFVIESNNYRKSNQRSNANSKSKSSKPNPKQKQKQKQNR